MPATRHVRRERRGAYNPLALPSLPSLPAFFSPSRSNTLTSVSTDATAVDTPDPEKLPSSSFLSAFLSSDALKGDPASAQGGSGGYSTDTTPFFLRRSAKSRRADDLIQRGRDSSNLLLNISNAMDLETVQLVASSCALLFDTVLTVRTNRTQTRMMLERVHQIVRALINLCGDAQRSGEGGAGVGLAPGMARAIDAFANTLTQLHAILQDQASTGLFARIMRHIEQRDQLAACDADLQQALDVFSVKTGLLTHAALGGVRRADKERHAEVVRALRAKLGPRVAVGTAV